MFIDSNETFENNRRKQLKEAEQINNRENSNLKWICNKKNGFRKKYEKLLTQRLKLFTENETNMKCIMYNVNDNKNIKTEVKAISELYPKIVKIEAGQLSRNFNIERKKYKSLDAVYYKSIEEKPIGIYIYLKKDNSYNIRFCIDISEISNIKEIIEVFKFYKKCLSGDISIDGKKEGFKIEQSENSIIEKKLKFWMKALKVEETIQKKIDATKIKEEDYITILKLYKSLVKKSPYKIENKIKTLTFNDNNLYETTKNMIGKIMTIEYNKKEEIELAEEKIVVYILAKIFNCKIKNTIKEEKIIKLSLSNSEEYQTFIVEKIFLSKKELEEEKNIDIKKYRRAEILSI